MKYLFITFAFLVSTCIVNAQPRRVRLLAQQYANSTWYDSAEELYSYDANGRMSEIISGGPNIATRKYSKFVIIYNSAGNIQHADDYGWDSNTSNWETTPGWVQDYFYNSSGKLEKIVSGPSVSDLTIDSFVYDGNGQLVEKYFKNSIEISREINTYNSPGQLTETINSYFNNNNWINRGKDENIYNNAGKISEQNSYYWDQNSSSWVYLAKLTFTYNSNGVLTERLDDSEPPLGDTRITYTYNADGTLAEERYQYLDGSTWINTDRVLYFYDNTSGISKISSESIRVYPNPSDGYFTIDFNFDETHAFIQVLDITGKQVFNKHVYSGNTAGIDLKGLEKGVYLLQLQTAKEVITQKIIVE